MAPAPLCVEDAEKCRQMSIFAFLDKLAKKNNNNRIVFDNGVWPVYKMKSSFISNFWLWSNRRIDNRTNSLLDFFDLDRL